MDLLIRQCVNSSHLDMVLKEFPKQNFTPNLFEALRSKLLEVKNIVSLINSTDETNAYPKISILLSTSKETELVIEHLKASSKAIGKILNQKIKSIEYKELSLLDYM
jgi:hypothetical protein